MDSSHLADESEESESEQEEPLGIVSPITWLLLFFNGCAERESDKKFIS